MALSESVENSLTEAESSLRNALAFAARGERSAVCTIIADMINRIDQLRSVDNLMDTLEDIQSKNN